MIVKTLVVKVVLGKVKVGIDKVPEEKRKVKEEIVGVEKVTEVLADKAVDNKVKVVETDKVPEVVEEMEEGIVARVVIMAEVVDLGDKVNSKTNKAINLVDSVYMNVGM